MRRCGLMITVVLEKTRPCLNGAILGASICGVFTYQEYKKRLHGFSLLRHFRQVTAIPNFEVCSFVGSSVEIEARKG